MKKAAEITSAKTHKLFFLHSINSFLLVKDISVRNLKQTEPKIASSPILFVISTNYNFHYPNCAAGFRLTSSCMCACVGVEVCMWVCRLYLHARAYVYAWLLWQERWCVRSCVSLCVH